MDKELLDDRIDAAVEALQALQKVPAELRALRLAVNAVCDELADLDSRLDSLVLQSLHGGGRP